jgi:hypothetical protein
MDVEAEAVYVDILRSLQSSILNSASVSNITNTVMNYRYSVSNPADSDPDPVLIRVTCYGILGLQGAFVQKAMVLGSVADPDPGLGAFLTPGSGMGESQHQDPGSGMNNPDHIF